jgi:hypothetical protein
VPFALSLFPSFTLTTMLTVDSLRARVLRLNELCGGLARETLKPKAGDVLDFVESDAYKQAIHDAIERLETARIVLVTAIQRIQDGAANGTPRRGPAGLGIGKARAAR